MTIHVVCAFLAAMMVFMWASYIDRVVTSSSGAIVTVDPPLVYQALDPSIIRSLDVKQGQRVGKGQVLATLDPTFAAATVNQFRAQIEGFRAEIARDKALMALAPLTFSAPSNDQIARYQKENLEYYNQQMAQYRASVNSFDQKIATLQTTIEKYKVDEPDTRTKPTRTSRSRTCGSRSSSTVSDRCSICLNATDAKIETQRQADYDRNSRIEVGAHAGVDPGRQGYVHRAIQSGRLAGSVDGAQ